MKSRTRMLLRCIFCFITGVAFCHAGVCPVVINSLKWDVAPPRTIQATNAGEAWFEIRLSNQSQKEIMEIELNGEVGSTSGGWSRLPYSYFIQDFPNTHRVTKIFPSHRRMNYRDERGLIIWIEAVTFEDESRWEGGSETCRKQAFGDQSWTHAAQFTLGNPANYRQ